MITTQIPTPNPQNRKLPMSISGKTLWNQHCAIHLVDNNMQEESNKKQKHTNTPPREISSKKKCYAQNGEEGQYHDPISARLRKR